MAGTITIKGGVNSVIQNDENDNLIISTEQASKQIYFQGTSSGDSPMYIDADGNTNFQDTASGQSVSLTVSQSQYGGYQVMFKSGSNWRGNSIRFIQDVSESSRALISLSGSSFNHAGVNMISDQDGTAQGSLTRMERGHGGMWVSSNPMGLSAQHFGLHPYSHSFCIGSGLSWGIAWGTNTEAASFVVQDSGYGIYSNPSIIHRLPTQVTNITASGNISASGTIYANDFQSGIGGSGIDFNDDLDVDGHITASGNISASGDLFVDDITADVINAGNSTFVDVQMGRLTAVTNITSSGNLQTGQDVVLGGDGTNFIHLGNTEEDAGRGIYFQNESSFFSVGLTDSGGGNNGLYFDSRSWDMASGNETPPMFIDAGSGKVGIGTSSPKTELHIVGDVSSSGIIGGGTQNTGSYDFPGAIMGYSVIGKNVAHDSYTLTTSFAVPDSKFNVVFVAPKSGIVEINVVGGLLRDASSVGITYFYLGLSDNSTYNALQSYYEQNVAQLDETGQIEIGHSWVVDGLTPGTTYQYWLGMKASTSTSIFFNWGGNAALRNSDVHIKVTALPSNSYIAT